MLLGSWTLRQFTKSLPLSTRLESIHDLEHGQTRADDREGTKELASGKFSSDRKACLHCCKQ